MTECTITSLLSKLGYWIKHRPAIATSYACVYRTMNLKHRSLSAENLRKKPADHISLFSSESYRSCCIPVAICSYIGYIIL